MRNIFQDCSCFLEVGFLLECRYFLKVLGTGASVTLSKSNNSWIFSYESSGFSPCIRFIKAIVLLLMVV